MSIDTSDLITKIDGKFWNHIKKETLVPRKNIQNKKDFLDKLISDIHSGTYYPGPPMDIIIFGKTRSRVNGVPRLVPSFNTRDYCIYYYCLRSLEDDLAKNVVENCFGAFRVFEKFEKIENKNLENIALEIIENPYIPATAFDVKEWYYEWSSFQKVSKFYSSLYGDGYILTFDIANFYDSIDLVILEDEVRAIAGVKKKEYVDLLFYFLRNWNHSFCNYSRNGKGIPQDEVGSCSRTLANFFLQKYDAQLKCFAEGNGCNVVRYSDDHIIFAHNKEDADKCLLFAAKELSKIGLNINSAKVKEYVTTKDFDDYNGFSIQNLIRDPKTVKGTEDAVKEYYRLKKNGHHFKYDTYLMAFLSCPIEKIRPDLFHKVIAEICKPGFLSTLRADQFYKLFQKLSSSEKSSLKEEIRELLGQVLFNNLHYNILKLQQKYNIRICKKEELETMIGERRFL